MNPNRFLAAALSLMVLAGCGSRAARQALETKGVPFTEASFLSHVRQGDAATVRQFLAARMSPDVRDADTKTALMWAAEAGHVEVVRSLLGAGARINERILRAHLIEIPFLTDRRKDQGWTALMLAIRARRTQVVRMLIGARARMTDVDPSGGNGLVQWACMVREPEMVRLLIEAGAPVDLHDTMGRSALFIAAQNGDVEIVRMLLDRKAEVNRVSRIRPETPLVLAARDGHDEVVRLLLQAGADPNVADHFGRTPLAYAEQKGRVDIALSLRDAGSTEAGVREDQVLEALQRRDLETTLGLIRSGANANARFVNELMGSPALSVAAAAGLTEAVRALLDAGADPNGVDDLGSTALHDAANRGSADIARLLLGAGARPAVRDRNHWTPLLEAAHSGHGEAVQALLEGGAPVDDPAHDGWTPLMVAARGGDVMAKEAMNVEAADVLLRAGANVDAIDRRGSTALIFAVQMRRPLIVARLIAARPALNARNENGETALSVAVARRDAEIEQLLRGAGATE